MSHNLYKTEALILKGSNIGEANKYIDLLTRDMGRIRAVARSVREEKSKLRFCLQDFSLINVSLIRGRDVWRIVGAQERNDFNILLTQNRLKLGSIARVSSLIRRLLIGEEKNEELFDIISNTLLFLKNNEVEESMLNNLECLIVLRILHNLGYIAKDEINTSFLNSNDTTIDLISNISPFKFDMIKKINTSLDESHL